MSHAKFHMSIPCNNIQETKKFYQNILGFKIGRKHYSWFDVNLYGNQITFTLDDTSRIKTSNYSFEDVNLPTFHFGIIISRNRWDDLYEKYQGEDFFAMGSASFLVDKKGHHESFFIVDPNGYFIEFKTFIKDEQVFVTEEE